MPRFANLERVKKRQGEGIDPPRLLLFQHDGSAVSSAGHFSVPRGERRRHPRLLRRLETVPVVWSSVRRSTLNQSNLLSNRQAIIDSVQQPVCVSAKELWKQTKQMMFDLSVGLSLSLDSSDCSTRQQQTLTLPSHFFF